MRGVADRISRQVRERLNGDASIQCLPAGVYNFAEEEGEQVKLTYKRVVLGPFPIAVVCVRRGFHRFYAVTPEIVSVPFKSGVDLWKAEVR